MPVLTPSRLALAIACFALLSLLWTLGLPEQLGRPARNLPDHYEHVNVHTDPIIPPLKYTPTRTLLSATTPGYGLSQETDSAGLDDEDDTFEKPTGLLVDTRPSPIVSRPTSASSSSPKPTPTRVLNKFCSNVRGAPNVVVNIRTSKAELEKLPRQLLSILSCVPNFAIFSDHAGEIDGFPIYNILEEVSMGAKRSHDEFKEYQLMRADPDRKPDSGKTKDLDKWKFLPMVYNAYHMNPSAKFHVFIEADTALSWTNLLQWVNRLDYRIPYYSGNPIFMNGIQVAFRGSGIMISQGALRRYAKSYDELYKSKWEALVGKECCGDLALGMAMRDAHVEFYASWPLLQSEQPNTLDYNEKHWCVPAVSWHHINGDDLTDMWLVERNWTHDHGFLKPYLYRDAFHDFVEPHMEDEKSEWDNMSQDAKIEAPKGRQQQLKDEEGRSKSKTLESEKKEQAEKEKKIKEEEEKIDKQKAKEKQEIAEQESKAFMELDSEDRRRRRHLQRRWGWSTRDDEIDWDRLADTHKDAGDSVAKCKKTCEDVANCLQWRYSQRGDGECHLSKVFRLGKKTEGDGGEDKWVSGWLKDRAKTTAEKWDCKDDVKWGFYQ